MSGIGETAGTERVEGCIDAELQPLLRRHEDEKLVDIHLEEHTCDPLRQRRLEPGDVREEALPNNCFSGNSWEPARNPQEV